MKHEAKRKGFEEYRERDGKVRARGEIAFASLYAQGAPAVPTPTPSFVIEVKHPVHGWVTSPLTRECKDVVSARYRIALCSGQYLRVRVLGH